MLSNVGGIVGMGGHTLKVKRLKPNAILPRRATPGATGFDLFACIDGEGTLALGPEPALVGTGVAIEVPRGYDVQIRPRSGLSSRGVGVAFGTVDSDYRGELLVTMYLFGPQTTFDVRHGDRIAQMVVSRIADVPVVEVDELNATERGSGGHGSTGR
jgi:dUTP pyrophosphatase